MKAPAARLVSLLLVVLVPAVGRATGGGPTGCIHICEDRWEAHVLGGGSGPCVVEGHVEVIAGSVIDCDTLDVEVSAANSSLTVEDGGFRLRANSLTVTGSGREITATCTAAGAFGFEINVVEDITDSSSGRLSATCSYGGGHIRLRAGDAVTLSGNKTEANGDGIGADAGSVTIRAGGDVTTSVAVEALNTKSLGYANGGEIEIKGDDLSIGGNLTATGTNESGGSITLEAGGTVGITAGTVSASSSQGDGDGGDIEIEAGGAYSSSQQLKALGHNTNGRGGTVTIAAESIVQDAAITASGGVGGGDITLESRGGPIEIGTNAGSAFDLDVTRSSNNPGDGGTISVVSQGGDVTIDGTVDLDASGAGSGAGGVVEVEGVEITTDQGSGIRANAGTSGDGGEVTLRGREALDLDGALSANNGGLVSLIYRETTPTKGTNYSCTGTCEDLDAPDLAEHCGDGILRAASSEECDGLDLDGETCTSQSQGTGDLACDSACEFDYAGCSGP
jgi:hypothetical protein